MQIFLSLNDNHNFHSILIKKKINHFTFLSALGYSGGGVFSDFYCKLKYGPNGLIEGQYSNNNGSSEWENKIYETKILNGKINVKYQEINVLMDNDESRIQISFLDQMKNYINWGYDEINDVEYDIPTLKKIDLSKFKNPINTNSFFNEKWDSNFLEITNSNIWPLSIRFPTEN